MLFALGLGDQVVAVTHECDYPPEAAGRRRPTRSLVPAGLSAGEMDAAVRRLTGEGRHLYALDQEALAELDVDLIVTQALCEVCAVSYDDVVAVAARLESGPKVISLDPADLGEVLGDVDRLGEAAGATLGRPSCAPRSSAGWRRCAPRWPAPSAPGCCRSSGSIHRSRAGTGCRG